MSLYKATICKDGDGCQVVVHWDDNDANRFIYAPAMLDHPIADEAELVDVLGQQGWRLVSNGSDNIGRGWAIVARIERRWPVYNPLTLDWHGSLSDAVKAELRQKYPDADIPGVR